LKIRQYIDAIPALFRTVLRCLIFDGWWVGISGAERECQAAPRGRFDSKTVITLSAVNARISAIQAAQPSQ